MSIRDSVAQLLRILRQGNLGDNIEYEKVNKLITDIISQRGVCRHHYLNLEKQEKSYMTNVAS